MHTSCTYMCIMLGPFIQTIWKIDLKISEWTKEVKTFAENSGGQWKGIPIGNSIL
jgi:hypothetical protein